MQLDLSDDEVDKLLKKKKNKRIVDLKALIQKEEERETFLSNLDPNRSSYIKECIEYYPKVEVQCNFKVEEETLIAAHDIFQITITVKSNRHGCIARGRGGEYSKGEKNTAAAPGGQALKFCL